MIRRSKFGNVRSASKLVGRMFDSRAEREYVECLHLKEQAKIIRDLELQPRYEFVVGGIHIGSYRPDARFVEDGRLRVIDVKGVATESYRMRVKLMAALHGIIVEEVRRDARGGWKVAPVKLRRVRG